MKTMKKVLSSVLLVCMLLSMCAVGAYAEEPSSSTTFVAGGTAQTAGDTAGDTAGGATQWPEGQNPNGANQSGQNPDDANQSGQNQNGAQNPAEAGDEAEEPEKEKELPFELGEKEVKFVDEAGNALINPPEIKYGEIITLNVVFRPTGEDITAEFVSDGTVTVLEENQYNEGNYGRASAKILATGVGDASVTCIVSQKVQVSPAAENGIAAQSETETVTTETNELAKNTLSMRSANSIKLADSSGSEEGQMYNASELPLKLTVTVDGFDANTATYSSSDTAVAIVEGSGETVKVKGVSEGTATITATLENGPAKLSTTYKIGVIPARIPVTGMTLEPATAQLKPGGTINLKVTFQPENTTDNPSLTWTTSDENVATVSADGLVTGVANGDAVITVTTADGSISATCAVKVSSDPVPVTGIQIIDENKVPVTSVDMKPGDNKEFAAVVTPDNADSKDVKWSSSDTKVFTVDETTGKVTAVAVGTAILTATAKDTSAVTATCTINVKGTFTVTPEQANIIPGGTVELKAMFDGKVNNSNIEWTSGDNSIATVDASGKVTGVAAGTVTITAHEKSGLYTDVTVSITVAAVGSNTIILSADKNPLTQRGGEVTIRARIFTVKEDGKYEELTGAVVDSITAQGVDNAAKSGTFYCNYLGNNTAKFRGGFNGKYKITAKYGTAEGTYDMNVSYSPAFTSGNNSVYNGKDELRFIVNDSIYNFNGNVWIDGMQLTNGVHFYSVSTSDGQIGIAINPAFLNYINRSAYHTITIGDNYGNASGYFRTWGATSTINGVKTGDDSNLALWLVLCLASAGCAATVIVSAKKRKNSK